MRAISPGVYRAHGALLQVASAIFVVLGFIVGMARSYRWQPGRRRVGVFHSTQCDSNPPQTACNVAPLRLALLLTKSE